LGVTEGDASSLSEEGKRGKKSSFLCWSDEIKGGEKKEWESGTQQPRAKLTRGRNPPIFCGGYGERG